MYKVLADGVCIYSDVSMTDETKIIDPTLNLSDNNSGSFTFTLPPSNIAYNTIERLTTLIEVYRDDELLWEGRAISERTDFWGCRNITCEGALSFLNDTIQPQAEYHDMTVRGFLEQLISIHNAKVEAFKQFTVGSVTVTDSNDSIYRYTNYEKTIECINDKLLDRLGGHIRTRKVNGVRYIDYLDDYPSVTSQEIVIGKNLLDFTKSFDMTDFATVIVPKGARLEESSIEALEEYLTVASVNNGSIYVGNQEAISNYGWVEQVVSWDDVTEPSNLLSKAQDYLSYMQFDDMVLELNAVDLHYLNPDIEDINILDLVRVISPPHGLDKVFPVTSLSIPLDKPENATFTLGDYVSTSFTSVNNSVNNDILKKIEEIPSSTSILTEAKANATAIMNMATNGYITITKNQYGSETLYISNTQDYTHATKLWKWNVNGLGYSNDGGQTWGLAMTMDGSIVADYVNTGTLTADIIKTGILKDINSNTTFNLSTGYLQMKTGNINLGNGKFTVSDAGYVHAINGDIGGFTITASSLQNSMVGLSGDGVMLKNNNNILGSMALTTKTYTPYATGTLNKLDVTRIYTNDFTRTDERFVTNTVYDGNVAGFYVSLYYTLSGGRVSPECITQILTIGTGTYYMTINVVDDIDMLTARFTVYDGYATRAIEYEINIQQRFLNGTYTFIFTVSDLDPTQYGGYVIENLMIQGTNFSPSDLSFHPYDGIPDDSSNYGIVTTLYSGGEFIAWQIEREGSNGQSWYEPIFTYWKHNGDEAGSFNMWGTLCVNAIVGNGGGNARLRQLFIDPDTSGVQNGPTKTVNFIQVLEVNADGTIARYENASMEFNHGFVVAETFVDDSQKQQQGE